MRETSNIYILKGFDTQETERLANAVKFVFNRANVSSNVKIISTLDITLSETDYLILYIDELTLNQIVSQTKTKDFFTSGKYKNKQILLLLDDINALQLPDYMLYLPAFELWVNDQAIDIEYANNESKKQSALVQLVYDMVMYTKQVDKKNKDSLTIYIGPSDGNTTEEFQKIIRELLHRNHNLIPKIFNPSAKEILEHPDLLENMLQESDLCIHFVSHKSIESFPEQISPALKVNELVSKFCKGNNNLQRIVYVPDETEETTESVRLKIIQFKSNLEMLINAELVQTPVEKLKHIVLAKIYKIINPEKFIEKHDDSVDDVYLIFAPGYEKQVEPVKKWLDKSNFTYSISQVDLDQLALLQYHQNKLKTCKGVLIFNHGNSEWLSRKLSDLLKAPGWGRKNSFSYKAIIGEPDKKLEASNSYNDSILIVKSAAESDLKTLTEVIKI